MNFHFLNFWVGGVIKPYIDGMDLSFLPSFDRQHRWHGCERCRRHGVSDVDWKKERKKSGKK